MWRLRWLGHIARMSDVRHLKRLLFGWFPQKRPAHGAYLRWRDKVHQDLKKCGITEPSWYVEAQDRAKWKSFCQGGLFQHVMVPPLLNNLFATPAITLLGDVKICPDIVAPPPVLDDDNRKE